jgi:hypothetical protein
MGGPRLAWPSMLAGLIAILSLHRLSRQLGTPRPGPSRTPGLCEFSFYDYVNGSESHELLKDDAWRRRVVVAPEPPRGLSTLFFFEDPPYTMLELPGAWVAFPKPLALLGGRFEVKPRRYCVQLDDLLLCAAPDGLNASIDGKPCTGSSCSFSPSSVHGGRHVYCLQHL